MNCTFIYRLALVLFGMEIWHVLDEITHHYSRRQFNKMIVLIVLLIVMVTINGLHLFL